MSKRKQKPETEWDKLRKRIEKARGEPLDIRSMEEWGDELLMLWATSAPATSPRDITVYDEVRVSARVCGSRVVIWTADLDGNELAINVYPLSILRHHLFEDMFANQIHLVPLREPLIARIEQTN
jgi:hypothetical protein